MDFTPVPQPIPQQGESSTGCTQPVSVPATMAGAQAYINGAQKEGKRQRRKN
jgi:hypothetical protein